jgi:rhamnulokinase
MPETYESESSRDDLYIAVDLGAGSGRVFLVGFGDDELLFDEVARFHYPPVNRNGHLRWDFGLILDEIKLGLKAAGRKAEKLGRSVRSLAIDSWGVDYGRIDDDGRLMADPICYRDDRTRTAMERVFAIVSREELFASTGIQILNFNTIYQLFSEDKIRLNEAQSFLLMPDLINYFLTGLVSAEYTNATTTQLVNARTKNWDRDIIEQIGLPPHLFPKVVEAGTDLGPLKPEITDDTALSRTRVLATASHDTASAVAAAPIDDGWAYISSGTWSLIGIERDEPFINNDVARHNFTNEGGAFGTIRFLKNVMGLWIFESCRKEWKSRGIVIDHDAIIKGVSETDDFAGLIFPDDERFLNPESMLGTIATQMRETGQQLDNDPVAVSKIIFDSLAFRYASVLRTIELLTARKLKGVQIVGGGGRNEYLNQLTADAVGLPVQAGLFEATVMGNAAVQAISAGRFASLTEARKYIRRHKSLKTFSPRTPPALLDAAKGYHRVESRYISDRTLASNL